MESAAIVARPEKIGRKATVFLFTLVGIISYVGSFFIIFDVSHAWFFLPKNDPNPPLNWKPSNADICCPSIRDFSGKNGFGIQSVRNAPWICYVYYPMWELWLTDWKKKNVDQNGNGIVPK
jgi:hypothetical protein